MPITQNTQSLLKQRQALTIKACITVSHCQRTQANPIFRVVFTQVFISMSHDLLLCAQRPVVLPQSHVQATQITQEYAVISFVLSKILFKFTKSPFHQH